MTRVSPVNRAIASWSDRVFTTDTRKTRIAWVVVYYLQGRKTHSLQRRVHFF